MNQSITVSPEAPHMKTADLVNESSEKTDEYLPVAVGTTVSAGDRNNFGTVVDDLGGSCIIKFQSIEGNVAQKEIPKSELSLQNGTRLAKSKMKFKVWSFHDLDKKHPEMRPEILHGFIRRGETVNVIGSPKSGKTWFAIGMAMSVAAGTPWLKRIQTEQGVVVYIDNELHEETIAERFRRVAEASDFDLDELNKNFKTISLRGLGVDIESLSDALDAIEGNVSMIVLDALYRFLPKGCSENDNADMTRIYNTLDRYAKRLDAAVVVVHHTSKGGQGGKNVTDVGSGAGSISRAADCHMIIRPHEKDGYFVIQSENRSFPKCEPMTMQFNWPCWHLSLEEAKVRVDKSAHTQRNDEKSINDGKLIVERFKSGIPFSTNDANKVIGGNYLRAARIVKEMFTANNIFLHSKFRRPRGHEPSDHYTVDSEHQFDEAYDSDNYREDWCK